MKEFTLLLANSEKFIFPEERQAHVLKHFSEIDKAYRELVNTWKEVDVDLDERFAKNVSKLNSSFASNPLQVIDRLSDTSHYTLEHSWVTNPKLEIQVRFKNTIFPGGVGVNRVIPRDERFHDTELFLMNGLFYAQHPGEITHLLNLVFIQQGDFYRVQTFFPGIHAPPVPDKRSQTKDQYTKSLEFWQNHVITH